MCNYQPPLAPDTEYNRMAKKFKTDLIFIQIRIEELQQLIIDTDDIYEEIINEIYTVELNKLLKKEFDLYWFIQRYS